MRTAATVILSLLCLNIGAQTVSVSTNALDYANLGTLNAEVGVATGRHISLSAEALYNPWNWGETRNRQRTFSAGVRWWPWNIWAGWWVAAKGQWREYNGNLFHRDGTTEEGWAAGGGFSIGYALMLSRHFNLDFGAGFWAGSRNYTTYACPRCGRITGRGATGFIGPNDIHASLVYVF